MIKIDKNSIPFIKIVCVIFSARVYSVLIYGIVESCIY